VIEQAIRTHCPDLVVKHGPFRGLKYAGAISFGSALFPKLLGSYEHELKPILEEICEKPYSTIIDVGCAEGYYAIGLALRVTTAQVIAFDINPEAAEQCRRMAELNGVADRVRIDGLCDPDALLRIPFSAQSLVVSDCEGYELTLFTPEVVQHLAATDVLIELHDFIDNRISAELRRRFSQTHDISCVPAIDDTTKAETYRFDCLSEYDLPTRRTLLSEWRPAGMEWIFCRPKGAR
jgi:precorrin-6B methylase 2